MKLSQYEVEKLNEVKAALPKALIGIAISIPFVLLNIAALLTNNYLSSLFFSSAVVVAMLILQSKWQFPLKYKIILLLGLAICGVISFK